MKKLFISVPMKGRTEENIKKSIEFMHKMAEFIFGEELEVIDSYIEGNVPETNRQSVWYLGASIQKLAEADFFIGIRWPEGFNGCSIENDVANIYEIPRYLVADWEHLKAFDDIKPQLGERCCVPTNC